MSSKKCPKLDDFHLKKSKWEQLYECKKNCRNNHRGEFSTLPPMFEKFIVEEFMVEKFLINKYRVENLGLKSPGLKCTETI